MRITDPTHARRYILAMARNRFGRDRLCVLLDCSPYGELRDALYDLLDAPPTAETDAAVVELAGRV